MRLVGVVVADRRHHAELALGVQRRQRRGRGMPLEPPVLGKRRAAARQRELGAQVAVLRVADRRQHGQRVDAAGQEHVHEHPVAGPGGLGDALLEHAQVRAAMLRRRSASRPRCAAGTGAGRAACRPASGIRGSRGSRDAPRATRRGAAQQLGAGEVLAAVVSHHASSAGRGTSRSARAARSGAARRTGSCSQGRSAVARAAIGERLELLSRCGRDRRIAPERERLVDRLGRALVLRIVRLVRRSEAGARHWSRRSSAPARSPCRASAGRPSPRRSAAGRAAGPSGAPIHVQESVSIPRLVARSIPATYTAGGFTIRGPL